MRARAISAGLGSRFGTAISAAPKKKLFELAAFIGLFLAIFFAVNYAHFQLLEVRVILYACLVDLVVATLVTGALWAFARRRSLRATTRLELALAWAIAFQAGLVYAIMGPTVIDRSLSLYIVEKLQQRGGAIAERAFPEVFVKEYMPEFRLVDVRLTEQLASGTVTIADGCVRLTAKGAMIADFTSVYRRHLLPRKRVLLDEVTDQLTEPFRDARPQLDTRCP